jgi:hypothetical protein
VSKSKPAHVAGFFFARCPDTPRGGGVWQILRVSLLAPVSSHFAHSGGHFLSRLTGQYQVRADRKNRIAPSRGTRLGATSESRSAAASLQSSEASRRSSKSPAGEVPRRGQSRIRSAAIACAVDSRSPSGMTDLTLSRHPETGGQHRVPRHQSRALGSRGAAATKRPAERDTAFVRCFARVASLLRASSPIARNCRWVSAPFAAASRVASGKHASQ